MKRAVKTMLIVIGLLALTTFIASCGEETTAAEPSSQGDSDANTWTIEDLRAQYAEALIAHNDLQEAQTDFDSGWELFLKNSCYGVANPKTGAPCEERWKKTGAYNKLNKNLVGAEGILEVSLDKYEAIADTLDSLQGYPKKLTLENNQLVDENGETHQL